jgi:hypothetical protein
MVRYTTDDVRELFDEFGGPTPEWIHDPTPKQKTNWEEHGEPIVQSMDDSRKAVWWYLRTYRPKKRGSGMMERDHVKMGEPEHYYINHKEGLMNPMGSIQGQVMASFGVSDEQQDEIEDAVTRLLQETLSDQQKYRIAEKGNRLARTLGL